MQAAAEDGECRGLILIAPFLGPAKPLPAALVGLLRAVPLPLPLIALQKKRIVAKFLRQTAAPAAIPATYQALAPALAKATLLYHAVLEKHESQINPLALCLKLASAQLPLLILYGKEDQVHGASSALQFLERHLPTATREAIPDGGHALLWTHAAQLGVLITHFCSQLKC
jgi:pimeloyl-ACP methyl ester carboxylesterase